MTLPETCSPASPGGVATLGLGVLVDCAECLHCGQAIPSPRKGQKACSAGCRWRLWKVGQQTAAQAKDRKIREYLLTAEESLEAAKRLLGEGERGMGEDP